MPRAPINMCLITKEKNEETKLVEEACEACEF